MARRKEIGTEYILISRKDYGDVSRVKGTFKTLKEAQDALQASIKAGEELILKIESRTLYNTDTIK